MENAVNTAKHTEAKAQHTVERAHADGSTLIHPYERAGLGKAPFRFIGTSQNVYTTGNGAHSQPGGCCEYCFNGILNEFWIKSADGKRFAVGSECVRKVGDAKLIVAVESAERKLKREQARNRRDLNNARDNSIFEGIEQEYKTALLALAAFPHPNQFLAGKGKTLADYFTFCMGGSIGTKRLKIARNAIAKATGTEAA